MPFKLSNMIIKLIRHTETTMAYDSNAFETNENITVSFSCSVGFSYLETCTHHLLPSMLSLYSFCMQCTYFNFLHL